MARDRRFVAVHRGGSLGSHSHQALASWAADCAEHVLPLFTRTRLTDSGLAYYAVKAVRLANSENEAQVAGHVEHRWQRENLPEAIRGLVEAALNEGTVPGN